MLWPITDTYRIMVSVPFKTSSQAVQKPLAWVRTVQSSVTYVLIALGTDMSTFLATYGAIFDGDLTSYSIGGPVLSLTNLGGLLGAPQGLSGAHNKYEGDVSPTRGDLYE